MSAPTPSCGPEDYEGLALSYTVPDFEAVVLQGPEKWKPFLRNQVETIALLPAEERPRAWRKCIEHYLDTVIPMKADLIKGKTNKLIGLLVAADLHGSEKSLFWQNFVESIRWEMETELINRLLKKGYQLPEAIDLAAKNSVKGFYSEHYVASDGSFVNVGNDGELLIFEPSGAVYLGTSPLTSYDIEKLRNRGITTYPDPSRAKVKRLSKDEPP